LDVNLHYSSLQNTQYCSRNAICVAKWALPSILPAIGPDTPFVPDLNAQADEADQIRSLFGREFASVVVIGTQHWPDNALGAAAGAIRTPGCLVLVLPEGLTLSENPSPYERHLITCLQRHMSKVPGVDGLWSILPLNETNDTSNTPIVTDESLWQSEQSRLIDSLVHRCTASSRSLDLVLSRRGRGKSAAIGRTIQQLMSLNPNLTPTLTASHQDHVQHALKHADLKSSAYTPLEVAMDSSGSVLFVDEAGSVPIPVLQHLISRYDHAVLAGTVDGYEGSGRALALRLTHDSSNNRFLPTDIQQHQLIQPIRWPHNDRLEAMIHDVLRLELSDTQTLDTNTIQSLQDAQLEAHSEIVTSEQLLRDDKLLDEVFALLMQAHYQTSSKDLQHLLNQNNLTVWIQRVQGHLSAACLVAHEGQLSEEEIESIESLHRRPQHQRLPMLLHRLCNDSNVLRATHWRIVRIAVQAFYWCLFWRTRTRASVLATAGLSADSTGVSSQPA